MVRYMAARAPDRCKKDLTWEEVWEEVWEVVWEERWEAVCLCLQDLIPWLQCNEMPHNGRHLIVDKVHFRGAPRSDGNLMRDSVWAIIEPWRCR
jgi:hypothetical protein